ncbi:hypothetical protein QAD02_014453 [Eretmocerus hayati]|uniref:Uncharacterized protein n=1 Tax=Eretmocerus hayati TaxID=131215 RepID=A0ACC2P5E0_9HYME|nr:hypothetical protein QAD02_014453 [Eretmocerus hayati]
MRHHNQVPRNSTALSYRKKIRQNFSQDSIVFPLFGYCGGFQSGTRLGSHANEGSLETFYVQPAILPPNIISKTDTFIATDIFLTKTRKEYCNKAVFSNLIQDAREFREEGVELNIKGKKVRVYFVLCLILWDNLALNSIFEFVASFNLTHFCRICYCGGDAILFLTKEDASLLRTVEKYEEDIFLEKSYTETGVRGLCAFNEMEDFHIIPNSSVDVMHDMFEGICHYVMAQILVLLVNLKGRFSIDLLNYRMRTWNFGFESSNILPQINYEYVRKNLHLKMSSSEMLFFVRYFAVLVVDLVPLESAAWRLYLRLRELVHLLTSPTMTESKLARLDVVITEHHELYVSLFGHLTAKFHYLLHYIRIIRSTGPVIKTSSIRFEAFDQFIKRCIEYSNCHVNILKTIGIRLQLKFMSLKAMEYESVFKSCGKDKKGTLANSLFFDSQSKREIHSVTLNGITYAEKVVIVVDFSPDGIIFGVAQNVFEVDEKIISQYKALQPCGFREEYAAHTVVEEQACDECLIAYDYLASPMVCLLFEINNEKFVVTRHAL